jgi:hypothetical protein
MDRLHNAESWHSVDADLCWNCFDFLQFITIVKFVCRADTATRIQIGGHALAKTSKSHEPD